MASQRTKIIFVSRKSRLALMQTDEVKERFAELYPHLTVEVKTMNTQGDKVLDVALSQIGDKGLFTRELERALLDKEVDLAVHSLKDLPTQLPAGLVVGAITKRKEARDALVVHPKHKGCRIDTLPKGTVVGTSSLRRVAQLKRLYPWLVFKDVRGNLQTRFAKLDSGEHYDALILAVAGLQRLHLEDRIEQILPEEFSLYAVGQGALGIECRADDTELLRLLEPLNDVDTAICCRAERAFLRELEGGCQVPIGVASKVITSPSSGNRVVLNGVVLNIDGSKSVRGSAEGSVSSPEEVGRSLAITLKQQGADEILAELGRSQKRRESEGHIDRKQSASQTGE